MIKQLKLGILNLMSNKLESIDHFNQVFKETGMPVKITYFYPKGHYLGREIPTEVKENMEPLELEKLQALDGFIISGSPIERHDFEEVTYIQEVRDLLSYLDEFVPNQLYICWGGMVALNYFYGIEKQILPRKLFGVYKQTISQSSKLLQGLTPGFLADHARYAEMNLNQIQANDKLQVGATTESNHLFLVEAKYKNQAFLFSHLEYDKDGLLKEYVRESEAHPEITYQKPENYFKDTETLTGTQYKWQQTRQVFFSNWMKQVAENKNIRRNYHEKNRKVS